MVHINLLPTPLPDETGPELKREEVCVCVCEQGDENVCERRFEELGPIFHLFDFRLDANQLEINYLMIIFINRFQFVHQ